jgi:hypothetical protein
VLSGNGTQKPNPSFSEEAVNEAFRRVRNRLRKHYPEEIILACIGKLNEKTCNSLEQLRNYPPWRLLLLIKWTIMFGEYLAPHRKRLTVNNFIYLINLMHDLDGHLRLPSQYEGILLFLRNIAFQQFWLQHQMNLADFSRQSILFDRLNSNHRFQKNFAAKSGITISQFLDLSIMLVSRFLETKEISVTKEWFRNVSEYYENGIVQKFLEFLSSDIVTLKTNFSKTIDSGHKISYEVFEKTPLRHTPLLKLSEKYYPFSPNLLARSLENKIYDTLRRDNPGEFMNRFGPIFEKYVGDSISKAGIPYLKENDLRRVIPDSKIVDYLIVDNGTNVLIDAKGVEMAYLGMVGHQPEIITDKTRDSVVKGIQQGFDTASRLKEINEVNGISIGKENDYLFVVTFKDMFLGNGRDFHDSVARATLDKIVLKYEGIAPIPYDHMYFISIDEFDLILSAVSSKEITLTSLLEKSINNDAVFETKKFTFEQHIREFCPKVQPPEWLHDEFTKITDKTILHLNQKT